ncbi:MAG: hypothetical protein KDC82_04250 [Bacteroidetes bacterium]|nr:hypothetical protein [Bacteroidota bacterium]
MNWKRVNEGSIKEPLLDYLEKLFDNEIAKGNRLKVAVGTDSQKSGRGYKFATVILIMTEKSLGFEKDGTEIFKGNGAMILGATFWEEMKASTKAKKHREIEVLNQRMILEVSKSIEVAYEIAPLLDLYGIKLEIHADINPAPDAGLSNGALSEAVGYILGMGYDFKVKPEAWAASKAADNLC